MPTISNVSFSVRFNLTGTPALVLTDTTISPPVGLVGIFEITQPDGYIRTGDIDSPDITIAGGSFSYTLSLDNSWEVQCGTYVITYTAAAPSYLSTNFTRSFVFNYNPVDLILTQQFDIFTPRLKYVDDTNYQISGFTNGPITRLWTATATPTGTLTSSTQDLDLIYSGNYYDAVYTITLSSSLLYTNETYSWLTINETISETVLVDACTPKTFDELVDLIEGVRDSNCSGDIPDFEKAQGLLSHMIDMISVQFTTSEFSDDVYDVYNKLISIFNITCNHTNLPIPTYPLSFLVGGGYGYTIEGGHADSIYLPVQIIDGGNA